MIRQYDISISTKSNKGDFFKLREELDTKLTLDDVIARERLLENKIGAFQNVLDKQNQKIEVMHE